MLYATWRRGAGLVAALAACTPQQNANVLPANQALTASTVSYGTIISSRAVQLQGGQGSQAAGAVLGGLAGAALGQKVGGGTGKVIATGVGATAGATAGLQAGKAVAGRQSIEWTVRWTTAPPSPWSRANRCSPSASASRSLPAAVRPASPRPDRLQAG